MPIFRNGQDIRQFLGSFQNHLSPRRCFDAHRREYVKLHAQVSLLAYCVLDNHFHLILHQDTADGMRTLMKRTLTSYGIYFNRRYGRRGPVFEARYAAKPLEGQWHPKNAVAYTHLNHEIEQLDYEFCSHKLYMGEGRADWVDAERGLAMFGGKQGYVDFVNRSGPAMIARKLEKRGLDPAIHSYRPIG